MGRRKAKSELEDLNQKWMRLVDDLYNFKFDYEVFKSVAVQAFAFLFQYRDAESIPREVLKLLFIMKEFAVHHFEGEDECYAAQVATNNLCAQIGGKWCKVDEEYSEDTFVIFIGNSGYYTFVDAKTFELPVDYICSI